MSEPEFTNGVDWYAWRGELNDQQRVAIEEEIHSLAAKYPVNKKAVYDWIGEVAVWRGGDE